MKAYMKETSEPLVEQYRELTVIVNKFIQLQQDNRVRWYEVEPIYLYYQKYLNRLVKKPYDFEGEIIDYMQRYGESTTRVLLQNLRSDMMKIITYYNHWQEFYNGFGHRDLLNMAFLYHKKKIEFALKIIHSLIDVDMLKDVPYDKDKSPAANFEKMQNKLQECRSLSLNMFDEYYNSMMESFAKVESFASAIRRVVFDFNYLNFTLQKHVDIINKFIGEPAPGTNFYPIGFDAPSTDCAVEPIVYLPKDLIESIYSLCNGNQFVNVDFENFYANFNLQKSNVSLIVKNKEKQRVYFLLHELSETISEDVRTTWLDNILENLKLEKSSYGKKYKEVDSITQRQSVKDYANNLKNIIKEYKA